MKFKKIFLGVFTALSVTALASCGDSKDVNSNVNTSSNTETISSTKLNVTKADFNVATEDKELKIKSEYLIENNGYKDSDTVIAIVEGAEKSLMDRYNDIYSNAYSSVAAFAESTTGKSHLKNIEAQQTDIIGELFSKNLISSVNYKYSTILNGFSVETTYGNLKKISNVEGVTNVVLSDTYLKAEETSTDVTTSAVENAVDVYSTGIYNSSSVTYNGNGTTVAVLDSGFDCTHSIFNQVMPDVEVITKDSISDVIDNSVAKRLTTDLTPSDVYYSKKIPFKYDYADHDSNVNPYDSEHGTHVAGIIGGKDDVVTGVAVKTQLVLMKVFSDYKQGAQEEDILAGLEDSVLLNVDCINMSLGSSCGFSREVDEVEINRVYDSINQAGISLIVAASNSYSSAMGGEGGNTNKVTNPDSATVGSPSTYYGALSVASISGVKSRYIVANGEQVFFFKESSSISGKSNDFIKELGADDGQDHTYEYVTVPGVGAKMNYTSIDVKGKIALVKRGTTTFEDKAAQAKAAGAIACIIYNNVEGDIGMSMGKSDHIPCVSISKEDGNKLAEKESGILEIKAEYQAGPFMSDFSSWGPNPDLTLKPEITAHGGDILSSIPGGGYDHLSGTSMASPNMCGIMVLIRQYIKEKYPEYSAKEINALADRLVMSTATIALNTQGNPYSPRKQGAGLASLKKAVNTNCYFSVDGIEKAKLELGDDPQRTGEFKMKFNVVNMSDTNETYKLDITALTETVSTSDEDYVAEKATILNGDLVINSLTGADVNGMTINVQANSTVTVELTYKLSAEDKAMIEKNFKYGMFVEGYVKLLNTKTTESDDNVDLNIPFLAFYGDWTQAPIFDKTYYEVESEKYDGSIDEDDKIKADYYATIPYGSYYYNYIIPLGTYLYDIDESKYSKIPASVEHISVGDSLGCVDGFAAVYAGLLRNCKTVEFSIVDCESGEVVYTMTDYNARKSYSEGGSPIPYYNFLNLSTTDLGLINNRQYEFKMHGKLDYGDGGDANNVRNEFSFKFYMDNEAPIVKDCLYEVEYDKTTKKNRYYLTMSVYDNHYVQAIFPVIFSKENTTAELLANPIPVYGDYKSDSKVRFEITDILDQIGYDALLSGSLAFSVDDYALNSNLYIVQLPGCDGDFSFVKDDGTKYSSETLGYEQLFDLTQFMTSNSDSYTGDNSYFKYLDWSSNNEAVATVENGVVKTYKKTGRAQITVTDKLYGRTATFTITVRSTTQNAARLNAQTSNSSDAKLEDLQFESFETVFAFSRASQTSEIGQTGDIIMVDSVPALSFYPGEQIKLHYNFKPWYAEDNYTLLWESSNGKVCEVDQEGNVKGLKKGAATIKLTATDKATGKKSNIIASIKISIKSEFVIENRTLVAYKGLGGDVVIPNDEGIMYIGDYSFCLYDTDKNIKIEDYDYDMNKIPQGNSTITSVVIPEGVEDVKKYAFFNCPNLKEVKLPNSIKYVRDYAFFNDKSLETINLEKTTVIGKYAFKNCSKLNSVDFSSLYGMGQNAFENCTSLTSVDLSTVRNAGVYIFKNCTALTTIKTNYLTMLSEGMFMGTGLKEVELDMYFIPDYCFYKCYKLQTVALSDNFDNGCQYYVGKYAFAECNELTNVSFNGTLKEIRDYAFSNDAKLASIKLPNCDLYLGNYVFANCDTLSKVEFAENTKLTYVGNSIFNNTNVTTYSIDTNSTYEYSNGLILDGEKAVLALPTYNFGEFELPENIKVISYGCFSGVNGLTSVKFNSNVEVLDKAFAECTNLQTLTIADNINVTLGNEAFSKANSLFEVTNSGLITKIGAYCFDETKLSTFAFGNNVSIGNYAFINSALTQVSLGNSVEFGVGSFKDCKFLEKVTLSTNATYHFTKELFENDSKLSDIDLSKADNTIDEYAFYNCSGLTKANLTNVECVGAYAFGNCSGLQTLVMPKVVEIGEFAFASTTSSLTTFTLPNTLTTIGNSAFKGCNSLNSIELPSSLTSLGTNAFENCTGLVKVKLANNLTNIPDYLFNGCTNLATINLANVQTIGKNSFASCTNLNNVDFTALTFVDAYAFAQAGLNVNLVADKLEKIGEYAFTRTKVISFKGANLKTISEGAFFLCTSLTTFDLSNKISSIGKYVFVKDTNLNAFTYNDKTTTKVNEYALLDNGILYVTMNSGWYELKAVPAALNIDKLVVLDGTVRIGEYAGNENKNITYIELPDTLSTICNYAFYGYKALKTVEFKSSNAPTLESTYVENQTLTTSDRGYEIIKKYYGVYDAGLTYFNFVDLAGKGTKTLSMVVPNADELVGYDNIVYNLFFGDFANATKSNYVPRDLTTVSFVKYFTELKNKSYLTLNDEQLVNNTLAAKNALKQDLTQFGYTQQEVDEMFKFVVDSKARIISMKLVIASQEVKDLNAELANLKTKFELSDLEYLNDLASRIKKLSFEDRELLNLTNYNQVLESYNEYCNSVNVVAGEASNVANNGFTALAIAVLAISEAAVLAAVVLKKW